MTETGPGALAAAARGLDEAAGEAFVRAVWLGWAAERRRRAADVMRARERALRKLIIWGARAEAAQGELATARDAEREQAGRVERAREVFAQARDDEAQALDEGVDPGLLVDAATRARTAAEICERQEHALATVREAREVAEHAVARAERRVRKARRKLDAAERQLSGPGLLPLPETVTGPGGSW